MDLRVRFGKPCVAGTRVDVATVVADIAADESFEAVQEAYQPTHNQVIAALWYAAHLAAHTPPSGERGLFGFSRRESPAATPSPA